MALYALEDVGDAIEATTRFLRPVDRVRWLRLAVVMFFVTSGGLSAQFPGVPGGGGFDADGGDSSAALDPVSGSTAPADLPLEVTPGLVALVVAILALLAVLALGYMFVAAVMEFVFVESLRTERVRLRRYARRHLRRGLRLFAFRLLVTVLAAGVVVGVVLGLGTAVGGWPPTDWSGAAILAVVLAALPLFVLAAVVAGTIQGFTTMFVVPVMLLEDRGVLSAWRRFWSTLVTEWKQFLAYAVAGFLLGAGVGVATSILIGVAALALAIPFLAVGVPVFFLLGVGPLGGAVLLILLVVYALLVVVVSLIVQVPFQTFLRYYALFVLGDANEAFDVISDARAAVRADGGGSGAESPDKPANGARDETAPDRDRSDDDPDGER